VVVGRMPLWGSYLVDAIGGGGSPSNPAEVIGYLWQGYIAAYGTDELGSYGDNQPWWYYTPIGSSWDYCGDQDYR
jgi:hypothetical protein